MTRRWSLVPVLAALAAACSTSPDAAPDPAPGCADVVAVTVDEEADGAFRFSATVRSADTGWEKYADRWEVRAADGTVLGVRELTHPHVEEQPFTRSLSGVEIPDGARVVTVTARDSVEGWCGATLEVELP